MCSHPPSASAAAPARAAPTAVPYPMPAKLVPDASDSTACPASPCYRANRSFCEHCNQVTAHSWRTDLVVGYATTYTAGCFQPRPACVWLGNLGRLPDQHHDAVGAALVACRINVEMLQVPCNIAPRVTELRSPRCKPCRCSSVQ